MTRATGTNSEKTWLVMIYIAADDVRKKDSEESQPPSSEASSQGSIAGPCEQFLDKLESLDIDHDEVHLVVLYDNNNVDGTKSNYRPSVLERLPNKKWNPRNKDINDVYHIFRPPENRELNSGHPHTLEAFVRWTIKNYEAEKKVLIIVGHGGGWAPTIREESIERLDLDKASIYHMYANIWLKNGSHSPGLNGICVDESSGSAISTKELRLALDWALQSPEQNAVHQIIDILFLDACLMGMVEVAYELRDQVKYLVAGENLMMATLAYYDCFKNLKKDTQVADLATAFVNSYIPDNNPGSTASWIIASIKTNHLLDIREKMNILARNLNKMIIIDDNVRENIYSAFNLSQKLDYRARMVILETRDGYVDLVDFLSHLNNEISKIDVKDKLDPEINNYKEKIKRHQNNALVKSMLTDLVKILEGQKEEFAKCQKSISEDIGKINGLIGTCIKKKNNPGKEDDYDLHAAQGLSIYLPLGEDDDRNDEDTFEKLKGKKHPQFYTEQLLFTLDASNWKDLLDTLIPKLGKTPVVEKPKPDKPRPYQTPRLRIV